MASWRTEPRPAAREWSAFRQVSPDWPPLYHAAGEPIPSQVSGRWHRQGEGYAQYLALEPMGAWAELVRWEGIRAGIRAQQYRRRLWLVFVREQRIADLSTFDRYHDCGLDPRLAVGPHQSSRQLADELRDAGYRGLLSPSAALVGATNLTLFGARYEKVLLGGLEDWPNPTPQERLPCSLIVEGHPPDQLTTETIFRNLEHDGYREWLRAHGRKPKDGR